MASVPISPIVLEDSTFTVEADDYTGHVSRVEFVPTRTTASWKSLSPASSTTRNGRPTWVVNVDGAQDWDTPNSLSRYLFEHEGEVKTVTFAPIAGVSETKWEAEVQIVAGPIGGAVDAVPVFSVALPVTGQPIPTYGAGV